MTVSVAFLVAVLVIVSLSMLGLPVGHAMIGGSVLYLLMAGPRGRLVMALVVSVAIVILYAVSLPASWSYVTFMKVEKSSYLKIRMDWLYSIYLCFVVAVIVRYLWLLSQLVRGRDPGAPDSTKASSGL